MLYNSGNTNLHVVRSDSRRKRIWIVLILVCFMGCECLGGKLKKKTEKVTGLTPFIYKMIAKAMYIISL